MCLVLYITFLLNLSEHINSLHNLSPNYNKLPLHFYRNLHKCSSKLWNIVVNIWSGSKKVHQSCPKTITHFGLRFWSCFLAYYYNLFLLYQIWICISHYFSLQCHIFLKKKKHLKLLKQVRMHEFGAFIFLGGLNRGVGRLVSSKRSQCIIWVTLHNNRL